MDVIGLNGERQNLPAFLGALALNQLSESRSHRPHQHRLAAPWAPDEVIDDEMDTMIIAAGVVCLFHDLTLKQTRPPDKREEKLLKPPKPAQPPGLKPNALRGGHFLT